jgi:uncharacterized membrane protein
MSFKGLMLVVFLGVAIFSYVQIKNHNPLSQDRVEENKAKQAVRGRYN